MPLKVDKKGQTASRPHLGKTLKTRRQFFIKTMSRGKFHFGKQELFLENHIIIHNVFH